MKKTFYTLALAALMVSCATQPKEEYYEKYVAFPTDATVEQKIDMVSRLVPDRKSTRLNSSHHA